MKTLLARVLPRVAGIACIAGAALLSACVAGLGDVPTYAAPAPLPEIQSLAPAPGMVWVAGGWHWADRDWVWIPGRWESPPPPPVLP